MKPIIFVQPFSLGSAGGGPRILRSLLESAPRPWRSISSSPGKPKPWPGESHLPSRPSWGPIEHSRLAGLARSSTKLFAPYFRARLKAFCRQIDACAIHALPHTGGDFAEAHTVARELGLPLFISVHDDLAYTSTTPSSAREAAMQKAWSEATARFVISDALGREYCRRYGERPFQIVTDGLTSLSPLRAADSANRLRIYFMGLFHMGYEKNLRAFLEAIALYEKAHPDVAVTLTFRCEHIRAQILAGVKPVTVLPFENEEQVQRDLEAADLLYLPLPFGDEHQNFSRFSLSTKMVTYLGSGLPILYHGPTSSAAFQLLQKDAAALFCTTLSPEEIARTLDQITPLERRAAASNALRLARREFMLADQSRKFWGTISAGLSAV